MELEGWEFAGTVETLVYTGNNREGPSHMGHFYIYKRPVVNTPISTLQ